MIGIIMIMRGNYYGKLHPGIRVRRNKNIVSFVPMHILKRWYFLEIQPLKTHENVLLSRFFNRPRVDESTKENSSVGNCFLNVCDPAAVSSFVLSVTSFLFRALDSTGAESFVRGTRSNLWRFSDSPNCLERLLDCLENEPFWIKIFIEQFLSRVKRSWRDLCNVALK